MRSEYKLAPDGFTLVELLMVIVLVGVLAGVSLTVMDAGIEETRFDETVAEMQALRAALVGDPTLRDAGERTHFGYVGDMGNLPTNPQGLAALVSNPGLPAWAVNTTVRFGLGWNGPYITGSGLPATLTSDAWGRAYSYNGSTDPATLTSLGGDGVVGGTRFNQDITVQIPRSLVQATVHGFISDNGSPYTGTATVDLNYPANGAPSVATVSVSAANNGFFSFSNVPLGRRSVVIYIPNKVSPTRTFGPIAFTVDNNNFIIPATATTFALTGAPGGGGGCTAGELTITGTGTKTAGNRNVRFRVNIQNNLAVNSIVVNPTGASSDFNVVTLDSVVRDCAAPGVLEPCPATPGATITLNSPVTLAAGTNRLFEIQFQNSMAAATLVSVQVNHSLGCDTLDVTF